MKKNSWPWIGSPEKEMGNSNYSDHRRLNMESNQYNLFDVDHRNYETGPSTGYSEGIISPIQNNSEDFLVPFDEENEKCLISIFRDDEIIAEFHCGVAKSIQEKVYGLQVYPSLEKNAGLVFEYKRPEDVIYHMGKVSFPIDILFCGENGEIKKIYNNIEPGTLATFGCQNVSDVLEICGGLCSELDIKVGDFLKKTQKDIKLSNANFNNDLILKYSNTDSFCIRNNLPILSISKTITKSASAKLDFVTRENPKSIFAIFIDDYLNESKLFASLVDEKSSTLRKTIFGSVAPIKLDILNKPVGRILKFSAINDLNKNETLIENRHTFLHFLPKTLLNQINDIDSEDIYIITKFDPKIVKAALNSAILCLSGQENKVKKDLFLKTAGNISDLNIIDYFSKIHPESDLKIICHKNIIKNSGYPVANDTKEKAKHARLYFERSLEMIERSLTNIMKNKSEFEKIQDNPQEILKYKDDFVKSEGRNKAVLKRFLIQVRNGIKILDEIKDASTTAEIIDYLASASKSTTDIFEEIFELKNSMELETFFPKLSDLTSNYEKSIEDLKENLTRARDYINSNILGLIIIAD